MGHYTRVTQAVSRMNRKPGKKLKRIGEILMGLGSKNGGFGEMSLFQDSFTFRELYRR